MTRLYFTLVFFLYFLIGNAQEITQTISGQITDLLSNEALPFATIIIRGSSPIIGTSSDENGFYQIQNIPIGRYDLEVSFLGYESVVIPEVLLSSAKEVIIDIQLKEQANMLDEMEVKPSVIKNKALNPMATVSAKMLSIEEASRYAGGFDDPARLATSFAGVSSGIANNAIIIRGNAPKFLQWKIENVEIPNPNHFANLAVFGGGGLTALSSNLLANSDFFTGAFPAEYNNAISGVFDIKMRSGNATKHEHSIELGAIGLDFSSEGPISKKNGSSYLVNYRYSTLGLVSSLLPEDAQGTNYQDLSFKFKIPTDKLGIFYVWGLGLLDNSGSSIEKDISQRSYYQDVEQQTAQQYMGAIGLNNRLLLSNKSYLNTTIALNASGLDLVTDRLNNEETLLPHNRIFNENRNLSLSSYLNTKYHAGHTNRTGINITQISYNFNLDEANGPDHTLQDIVSDRGASHLLSAYTSSAFTKDKWSFNLGINAQLFTLNKNYTLEPRIGVSYQIDNKHKLGLAYGLHSRLEALNIYLANTINHSDPQGNKELDFTKAHHLVLSYNWSLSESLHLKVEPYYQYLTSVPSIPNTNISLINLQNDWFINDVYQNTGSGRNYGLDLTLEKYISKGFYFLVSGSIFESQYRADKGAWYNTRFNKQYIANVLVGKEWRLGKKQRLLGLNFRLSALGGERYSPIDLQASLLNEDVEFNESNPFSERTQASTILHFTLNYEWFKRASSHKLSLKILNALNEKEFHGFRYNFRKQTIEEQRDALIIPNLSYKYSF